MEEFYETEVLKNITPSVFKDETTIYSSNIKGKCSCCLNNVTYS